MVIAPSHYTEMGSAFSFHDCWILSMHLRSKSSSALEGIIYGD